MDSAPHTLGYLVRIIDPDCKTSFITKVWHDVHTKFATVKQLKQSLIATFEEKLPTLSELKCGYLEKRTNAKRWIEDDKDLEAMYKTFSDKADITIWCEGPSSEEQTSKRGKKRKSDDSSGTSKRSAREESIDEIVQTLRRKHGEDYSTLQYKMWARMKLNGQQSCLEEPSPYPLFNGGPSENKDSLKEALTSCAKLIVG